MEKSNNVKLILLRGLPGSGKTTVRDSFFPSSNYYHLSADSWFYRRTENHETGQEEWVYRFNPKYLGAAHRNCQRETFARLISGYDVVVDNTFTTEKELKPYYDLAERVREHGKSIQVYSLVVENRHGGVSVHDVPESTIDKMENRFSLKLRS